LDDVQFLQVVAHVWGDVPDGSINANMGGTVRETMFVSIEVVASDG
jgi:hypothetical protein